MNAWCHCLTEFLLLWYLIAGLKQNQWPWTCYRSKPTWWKKSLIYFLTISYLCLFVLFKAALTLNSYLSCLTLCYWMRLKFLNIYHLHTIKCPFIKILRPFVSFFYRNVSPRIEIISLNKMPRPNYNYLILFIFFTFIFNKIMNALIQNYIT